MAFVSLERFSTIEMYVSKILHSHCCIKYDDVPDPENGTKLNAQFFLKNIF